jgi:hypothetical protein
MKDNLSVKSDDLRLGRVAATSSRLNEAEIRELSERLDSDACDLVARARLLEHYGRSLYSSSLCLPDLVEARFEHILWFVENIPESKFCGERYCYLDSNDQNYATLKEAWLKQIKSSTTLMPRVNAFMFFANAKEPKLERVYAELLKGHENNLWVAALQALLNPSFEWLDNLVQAQIDNLLPPLDDVEHLIQLANGKQLLRLAAEAGGATNAEFLKVSKRLQKNPLDLQSRSFALGFTFSCHSDSILGFDPELTLLRFEHMCWVIRNIPGSEFASHALAIDPFLHSYTWNHHFDCLNEALASLWSKAIAQNPDHDQTLLNAAIFCYKAHSDSVENKDLIGLIRTVHDRDETLSSLKFSRRSATSAPSATTHIENLMRQLTGTRLAKKMLQKASRRYKSNKLPPIGV